MVPRIILVTCAKKNSVSLGAQRQGTHTMEHWHTQDPPIKNSGYAHGLGLVLYLRRTYESAVRRRCEEGLAQGLSPDELCRSVYQAFDRAE